jgi:WS/DGAT/MGAT family acyltransferase
VADRLNALDSSFYFAEAASGAAMHIGGLARFDALPDGVTVDDVVARLATQLAAVPRLRQRIRTVPTGIARPVWVDDSRFDIKRHVRTAVLPRPGSAQQLDEFVARVMARQLDREHPLWEVYVVDGLYDDGFALVSKSHHALVDGIAAVDVMQVILSPSSDLPELPQDDWTLKAEPTDAELVADALGELMTAPSQWLSAAEGAANDVTGVLRRVIGTTVGLWSTVRAVTPIGATDALTTHTPSGRRVFTGVLLPLDQHRSVRAAYRQLSGETDRATVNDVVLAVVTGGLRTWMLSRGEALDDHSTVRALVPVSLRPPARPGAEAQSGNVVSPSFVDLPIGLATPQERLAWIAGEMREVKESGQTIAAKTLIDLVGIAPMRLHALAARTANAISDRVFGLTVTNVPGPQVPLYASGARLKAIYPVAPIAQHQVVSIAVASYNGEMGYGLIGDADAMTDLDVLATGLSDELAALMKSVQRASSPRQRQSS